MNEVINGYELMMPFSNKGAGFSRWTLAAKEVREFFLKEFMNPVYPMEVALEDEIKQQRIEECEEFEKKKVLLYKEINELSDGNIVRIYEFFRCDSHYYISTERITPQDLSYKEIQKYPIEERVLLCKIIAHAIMKLHEHKIVHADLKENNILLKMTQMKKITAKIIDFDCSFFEDDPPKYEDELGGDQVYLAPEACMFMCGEPVKLTCKIDVFSLGIIFHQILAGVFPWFDSEQYDYVFEAVLDSQPLGISSVLDSGLRKMIRKMLVADAEKRISMQEVYLILEKAYHDLKKEDTSETPVNNTDTPESDTDPWFHTAGDL